MSRPYEIANYGNRDVGIVLAALALVGGFALLHRRRPIFVLLIVPFVLAVAAALLGKYPLAHRTGFFLLPCLWLLAALGFDRVVQWGQVRGWNLAPAGVALVAWNLGWLVAGLAVPDSRMDFRGAYRFVQAHCRAGDAVWSQTAVVYQTYYGKDAAVFHDADFSEVERLVSSRRVWAVMGSTRHDFRERLEAAGARVVLSHRVSGLSVLLFEPASGGR